MSVAFSNSTRSISPISPIRWYGRLRIFAFTTQLLLLIAATSIYNLNLSVIPITSLLLIIPLTQIIFHILFNGTPRVNLGVGILLIIDTLILTGLLYYSGGPNNPFSLVYLVHVVLAAVMLNKFWTWSVAALTSLCFSALFLGHHVLGHHVIAGTSHMDHHNMNNTAHDHALHTSLSLHLQGMLFSYVIVTIVVAYFLSRILDEKREKELLLQESRANHEKISNMAALTANAAHELATPLSSIQLLASEIEQSLGQSGSRNNIYDPEKNQNDLHSALSLLKSQIARCRDIIDEMCAAAGNITGEGESLILVEELFSEVLNGVGNSGIGTYNLVRLNNVDRKTPIRIQKRPVIMALRVLLKNSIEATLATDTKKPIEINCRVLEDQIFIEIKDFGKGIPAELLSRVGEPFFSTKDGGSGMGLGVYIARLVATQLGGKIIIQSESGKGTTIEFILPQTVKLITPKTQKHYSKAA